MNENIKLYQDIVFKSVFSHKEILKDFTNCFYEYIGEENILTYTSVQPQSYIIENYKLDKGYFGDIIGVLDNEKTISIEMYSKNYYQEEFNKSIAYLFRIYTNQRKDKKYKEYKEVEGISIVRGKSNKSKGLINKIILRNEETGERYKNIGLYIVRLDQLKKEEYIKSEKRIIRWLKMLNSENLEEMKLIARGDENMEAAIEYARELVEESTKNGVERYLFNLKRESKEKGMIQGEKNRNIEIAKNLLNLNTDVNTISKATGLTIKEINKLK